MDKNNNEILNYTMVAVKLCLLNGDAAGYIKSLKPKEQKEVKKNLQKVVETISHSWEE